MKRRLPKLHEKWVLNSDRSKIAEILSIEITDPDHLDGYVYLAMPWTKKGHGGKALNSFMKFYIRCNQE